MALKKHDKKKKTAETVQPMASPDPQKLQELIAQEGQKIQNAYLEIGKRYAAGHRQKADPEFAPEMAVIAKAEAQILELWKALLDLKGMIRCSSCGSEIAKESVFCPFCGTPARETVQPEPEAKPRCPQCGVVISKDMRFCIQCGHKVAPEDLIPVKAEAHCKQCAADAEKGLQFCTACGKPVRLASTEETAGEAEAEEAPVLEAPVNEEAVSESAAGDLLPEKDTGEAAGEALLQEETEEKNQEETGDQKPPMPAEEIPARRVCMICDSEIPEGMQFCTVCGTKY